MRHHAIAYLALSGLACKNGASAQVIENGRRLQAAAIKARQAHTVASEEPALAAATAWRDARSLRSALRRSIRCGSASRAPSSSRPSERRFAKSGALDQKSDPSCRRDLPLGLGTAGFASEDELGAPGRKRATAPTPRSPVS